MLHTHPWEGPRNFHEVTEQRHQQNFSTLALLCQQIEATDVTWPLQVTTETRSGPSVKSAQPVLV